MFLLDTNIVSELRKPKPHGGVVAWTSAQDASSLYLCAMTIAATASVHRLVVATRNVRDFKTLGVDTLNPFERK